jgi:hypothetical protein
MQRTQDSINNFIFWINPVNWFKALWAWVDGSISTGALDAPFISVSIGLVILIMLGAKWPKKYLFWGWVVFWLLRGFICV